MSVCPACNAARHHRSHLGEGRWHDFQFSYQACAACGSLFVDPMPSPAILDAIYGPGYLDEHYAAELHGESKSEELAAELRRTVERVATRWGGGRVLDVGCGAGELLVAARDAGFEVEGLEVVTATAERIAARVGVPVHAGELSSVRGRYDVVHFADVLEHSPTPLVLLEGAKRLLKPGGAVLARGPLENHTTLFQMGVRLNCRVKALIRPRPPATVAPTHVILFTLEGWRALASRAGLHAVEESVSEQHWPAPEQPTLSAKSLLKEVSLRITRSPVGRRLGLGDRVVSVLSPASPGA